MPTPAHTASGTSGTTNTSGAGERGLPLPLLPLLCGALKTPSGGYS
jgi:hypothetical protein